jgi:hypothetical protein
MDSLVKAIRASCDQDTLWVVLSDGRTLGTPLAWFPRLLRASAEERARVRISNRGLHWDLIDEDISIAGLLAGQRDQQGDPRVFAA